MEWYEKRRHNKKWGGGAIRNVSYMDVWKLTKFPTRPPNPRLPPRLDSSFLTLQQHSLPDLLPLLAYMRDNTGTYGKAVQAYIAGSSGYFPGGRH